MEIRLSLIEVIQEAMEGTKQGLINLLKETVTLDPYGEVEEECAAAIEVVEQEYSEEDVQGFWRTFNWDFGFDFIHTSIFRYDNIRLGLV
ncbi:hypothetical protein [Paenibacillus sp. Root444D2]|uniref:hypothetical protein n=1 Tax=Paenibacillus sp. Root444D2 TaxID=1736538 RepID=UPI00070D6938|nr:hypothetical protein [Paenibacillus sp. Root444D2]KQX69254.1 hypothetical protein ASD40_01770 [Paenibacillus sp. Root444D2]